MTILVVDDEDAVRDVLMTILMDDGYRTVGAINGREAVACLRQDSAHIDLILMDVMMPEMSGWDVLSELKRDPTLATIPVVIMTAGRDVHQQALAAGAASYLPKPINIDTLLATAALYSSPPERFC